jgi:hypothetical protein
MRLIYLSIYDKSSNILRITKFYRIEIMKSRRINADKPHLWKADIAFSVDQFNQWFIRFAPEAFRSTRV